MKLTKSEQVELQRQAGVRNGRADSSRHARLILLLADGLTWAEIRAKLDCSDSYIDRWSKRFAADRLAGLFARYGGRERYKVTDQIEARVLAWTTKRKPADGSTHWSSRKLATELGDISHMTVRRIWAKHSIKPHRLEGYLVSNDPDFERKAADVIGLYLNAPQHAAVFCVDEKTAIQALDRTDPVLPLSPGRAERHGFEHFRHGTLSLYTAFNTMTGEVMGNTAERHTSAEFVAFLTDLVVNQPRGKEIHVIADNLSAHKTQRVEEFLVTHRNAHLHFTPTYSSWLNQVELWFAKIERDVIARGSFTSVPDLKRKLIRYIRHYNKQPKPVKWKYFDTARRITPESIVTVQVDQVISAVLPGRYPTPKGCSEDYAVTKLLKHRRTLTEAAKAFLLADEDGHENAKDQLLALLLLLDPNAKPAWNARAIKTHESLDWKQRWEDAVDALRRAADLLDDPVTGSNLRPKWRLHPNHDPAVDEGIPEDMGAVDAIVRYVEFDFLAFAVRRIANAIEEAGWENIVPTGARYRADQWHGVSPKLIGRRGGAADDKAASRALLVKELAKRVPPNARHRYALIARLAAIPGVHVSRQYVASLLKGGRT